MHNCAIFVRLSNVRPHPNADRLQLATVLGNQVVVGLSAKNGDLGIYFDSNLQLSKEFAVANDLIRRKNPQTGKQEGGMFDPNCKVRTQKFRGEISDGFWCPTSYLEAVLNPSKDVIVFDWDSYEGYEFNDFNGVPICKKFVPVTSKSPGSGNPKAKSKKCSIMFKEHFDTEQFGKHVMDFKPGDLIIITEKLHGTSQRVGHVLVDRKLSWIDKLLMKLGVDVQTQEWQYLNGTRRVVLDKDYKSGTGFHSDELRDAAFFPFFGNLRKGETVYFEVVGFEPSGNTIMPAVDYSKFKGVADTVIEHFGKNHSANVFSYGCLPGESKVFVYRITHTNEDGHSIDLSWKDVKHRCAELGVNHVPELLELHWPNDPYGMASMSNTDIESLVSDMTEGLVESTLDPKHYPEGVCVRIESGLNPQIYKHKSFIFKFGEGLIKEAGISDMEDEASEVASEEVAL